ncbi:MAG: endonuclease domain-containing protein [Proteobacteria bacterium]|nr:endonuclease domain-containing protein [Pseudomonadota bacterium]
MIARPPDKPRIPPHPSPLPGGEREACRAIIGKRRPRKQSQLETVRARDLRGTTTYFERQLWAKLRGRQFGGRKFRRQVPIAGFVADFACLEASLIIELDGDQHGDTVERDERRTAILKRAGFRVLRFWNSELNDSLEDVLTEIEQALGTPSPRPSPRGGEGE